ncbi:MAG: hypothetical protein QOE32_7349, partial [Pseudonocardiales bacterium]|nr:hypothetical protein [Pseudonocardiales bacterium]
MSRELLPTAGAARVRTEIAALLRPHRGPAALATLALLAGAAVSLLTAPLLGRIVDLVAQGRPASAVDGPVAGLVGVALGQGVFAVLGVY